MPDVIVAIFSNTQAAYNAAKALKELDDAAGRKFKLKSGIIVSKDDKGEVSVLESDVHLFRGTKVSAVVGGLVGLIGGAPFAAVAALLGATLGAISDGGKAILKSATATSIKNEMHPGTTAVIMEADEDSPTAVDEIVALGAGRVFRQAG